MLQKVKIRDQKGFTLIELMIVIAIIGVLAAIAIPNFIAYRTRSYNSVGATDCRNWIAAEAALMQDGACYGVSTFNVTLNTPGGTGAASSVGTLVVGGRSAAESIAASANNAGICVTGSRNDGQGNTLDFAFPVAVGDGNKVQAAASVSTQAPLFNDSYVIWSEHIKGNRAFAADSDVSNTLYFVEDDSWTNGTPTGFDWGTPAVPTIDSDDVGGVTTNAAKITAWTVLK